MAETAPRQSHVNLWELRMDARMGQAQGQPQRIANFSGSDVRCLSANRDGKRLAFLQEPLVSVCWATARLNRFVFYLLDPLKGRGREIATAAVELPWDQSHWDVSPDGSHIALLAIGGREGRIRILSLAGGSPRDVVVEGWSGFQSMDWAANGQGLYVSSHSAMHSSLLHIDLNGQATLLRQQMGSFETWGIPSPNGRHLAFLEWSSISNVWMMDLAAN